MPPIFFKKLKYLLVLPLVFISLVNALAQGLAVKGKVTDENGGGLPGVTVLVKGTTNGTATDADGNYSISVPAGASTLVVTFIGYATQEVAVNNRTALNIALKPDAKALEEVVVVGYGTAERKDLTGAVTSLSAKEIATVPVSNVAEAMKGRMAGVQVTTVDGQPGAEIIIRVRGGGSITQDNAPLYIVDGFPVNSINDIAPADIESIDILKDASAAAIYGSRGSNGVVQITTKSAKAGKTSISYNGFAQMRTLPRKLEVLSPYEFVLAQYENAVLRGTNDLTSFNRYFGAYEDLELYKRQRGTDWQQELFGKPAMSQQHNLSITGGTDKTKLSLSFTNNKDEGIMVGSAYERTYLNVKINQELFPTLKLDFASRFANTVVNGAGTSGGSNVRISDGITTRPVNGLADAIVLDPADGDDDYDAFVRSMVKPTELATQDYRLRKDRALNVSTALNWSILKSLTFRSELGLDLSFGNNRRYYGPLTGTSRDQGGNLPLGEITTTQGSRYRVANTLTYKWKQGDKHNLNVLVGQEVISGSNERQYIRSKFFSASIEPDKMFANMGLGTMDQQTTFLSPDERLLSGFGRLNYELNDRYLFTATMRADASNKFAPGRRLGVFPAASVGWRLSEENFIKGITAINDLKLRLSYGEAGNNRIQDDLWRRTFSVSTDRGYGMGDINNPYYRSGAILVNPELRWETTITRNIGLDYGLFNNRISGTVDAYHNTTQDLLVLSTIPITTGYPFQQRNIGQTSNRGIEMGLNTTILDVNGFTLSGSFNAGINRSNIDKLDGVDTRNEASNWAGTDLRAQDDYRIMVGNEVGLMYGYVTEGFYSVDDFESYNPTTRQYQLKAGVADSKSILGVNNLRPGFLKLKDLDGDGMITPDKDREIIGRAQAKATGGFGFNAAYKGFDFSSFFNWVLGNDVYNTGRISMNMYYRSTYGNMLNTVNSENRFKYINESGALVTDLEALRELNQNANIWSPFSMGTAAPVFHSWAVEDGSHLRLSNVSLGYTLPRTLTSRAHISQFRVYGTVNNAWLWTKYSGYDPEVSTTRSGSYAALTPGVDYSAYPKSRNFTVGVNVTF